MATREQLILRDKQLLVRSASLAETSVRRLMPDLSRLSQAEAGGAVRTIALGTVDQFGKLATSTAQTSYNELRGVATQDSRSFTRYSAEQLTVDATEYVDSAVGASMARYTQGLFAEASSILALAIGREVANIYRQTMSANIDNDRDAVAYQRVASPTACAFCLVVALNQYTTSEDAGGYHNDCGCTTTPIFRGQGAYRPDYYDEFESIYLENTDGRTESYEINGGIREFKVIEAKATFASIREATGRN